MGSALHLAIDFEPLLCSGGAMRSTEADTGDTPWWSGYMRGLRRATQGESFGTEAEHDFLIAAADSADASRSAMGNGYKAGLLQLFSSTAVAA
jgi:hypothetical protein